MRIRKKIGYMSRKIIVACGMVLFMFAMSACSAKPADQIKNVIELNNPMNFSCMYQDVEHKFNVCLPNNYDSQESHPLILMLHGYANTAEGFSLQTKFENEACPKDYVVVYLNSTKDSKGYVGWNSGIDDSDKDDVGFIKALAAYLQSEYNCDPKRTFAVGFSNGAFMTQRLAVEADDTFAAVASVAGMMPQKAWDKRKEKSDIGVLEIYGTKDDVVPMKANGSDRTALAPAIEDVMEYWATANSLIVKEEGTLSKRASYRKWTNEKGTQFVWEIIIEDGRHSWPEEKYCGFSTNQMIIEFFDRF